MEHRFGTLEQTLTGWPTRLIASAGFAGILALLALISFPLPWTPVPFSLLPLGLLLAGAYQRPLWGFLSVAMYLVAAGIGAPIFADGESGWSWFIGATGGYLFGFLLIAPLVGWYMRERRGLLPTKWVMFVLGAFTLAVLAGLGGIIWMMSTGNSISTLDSDAQNWNLGRSTLWVLLFLIVAMTTLTITFLRRYRQQSQEALNLFLVMMGATIVLHACGVTVLWMATSLTFMESLLLGSLVFLPFDVLKSGLAVALSLPFVPPVNHD